MAFIEDILNKLGWNDGFQIPVANRENQELEKELATLTFQKAKAKTGLDNTLSRLTNLKEHFKFVLQENEQTQKLITAHKQQYDTERNSLHSLKGEKNKLETEIAEVNKKVKDLECLKENLKKDLEKAVIKVDRIKQETGWDIEALKAWEEALKKRDDDNELLKKFSKEDERRFNVLEARRQFLQCDYDNKTMIIAKAVCELHSLEMIIERTGKAVKQQMNEREALIKQWKDAVKMLQTRDQDISKWQERIGQSHDALMKQQEILEEENQLLKNEIKNNKEIELEIESLNAMNSRIRRELGEFQQNVLTVINEVQTVKRHVALSANSLEKIRMKNRMVDYKISEKERHSIKDKEDLVILEDKIRDMEGNSLSSSERINRIQKMIEHEQKHSNMLMADTEKINNSLYRTDQMLKEQQGIGKSLEVQMNNLHCISTKLRKHIVDEKKSLEKIKEVVYDMQYRIDEFEQRLCKLEGSNKREDHMDEKEEKIRELEKILGDYAEVQHTLQTQVNRLQDEMRRLSNFIATDKEHLSTLQNKVENHMLEYDIGRKQIIAARNSTQEKQVEENIMRLRINHIEQDMKKEEKKIFSLQKLRVALDQAMKERNVEIETKRSIVFAKKRNLEEEKGRLKGDISLRKIKVEQLQKKYHIELMSLGKDEDGQPLSVTHFKIKAAQDKYMLQQEGDELDQKIKIAEKEIVAMENTLKMVNLTNVAFKGNLSQIKEDDPEIVEMKALDSLLKEWQLKVRKARQQLSESQAVLEELKRVLNEELKKEVAEKKEHLNELEEENLFIEKQEHTKEEKLKRAELQLRKTLKKLNLPEMTIYDQDLEIRQMKDANNAVLKHLNSMLTELPDVAPNINKYAAELGVNLKTLSSFSSKTFSTCSSVGSNGSSSRSLIMQMTNVMVKKLDVAFKE
ncbi:coiled-coil domain-containing protein 39 [Anthonomus grandis grandis]|uniref:coiled-coil domain-containing protein 39 n=1 Tax=Anthonomus grandis grandis TaxID=2921223 RepID=UPI002166748E|nr:coiled-coil domain-containing protein 39 [Anthonomus grandis grandis]